MAGMSAPEVARRGAAREGVRQRFGLVPISAAGDATQRRNCTPITPEPVILRASGCGTPGRSGLVPAMMPHRAAAGGSISGQPIPSNGSRTGRPCSQTRANRPAGQAAFCDRHRAGRSGH